MILFGFSLATNKVLRLKAAARRGIIAFTWALEPVAKGPVEQPKMSRAVGLAKVIAPLL